MCLAIYVRFVTHKSNTFSLVSIHFILKCLTAIFIWCLTFTCGAFNGHFTIRKCVRFNQFFALSIVWLSTLKWEIFRPFKSKTNEKYTLSCVIRMGPKLPSNAKNTLHLACYFLSWYTFFLVFFSSLHSIYLFCFYFCFVYIFWFLFFIIFFWFCRYTYVILRTEKL